MLFHAVSSSFVIDISPVIFRLVPISQSCILQHCLEDRRHTMLVLHLLKHGTSCAVIGVVRLRLFERVKVLATPQTETNDGISLVVREQAG